MWMDRVRPGDQPVERCRCIERTLDPRQPVFVGLRAAGESTDFVILAEREIDEARPDEAGAAGDGEDAHSSAIWLRCTSAARGA